jgi:hypothetical protein
MTSNVSLFRTAALTGAAAFLLSFAPASPAAAQDPSRYMTMCTAHAEVGQWGKSCTMTVPAGKVFIIESATVYGGFAEGQRLQVTLTVRFNGANYTHAVPAATPMVDENGWGTWTGAIPGTIFSEGGFSDPGQIFFNWSRWGSATGQPTYRVTLSGRLEDK